MPVPTPAKPPIKLVLVDDDDDVRRSIHLLLQSLGYAVIAHSNADDLASDPNALRASCLIADLSMPRKGGLELLAEMRAKGWRGKSILISGYPVADWSRYVESAGFDAALTKPLGASILARTIERLLEGSASSSTMTKARRPGE